MKFIQWVSRNGRVLGLTLIPLGIAAFTTRFLYGRANELGPDGELHLTNTGIVLSIVAVINIVFGLFAWTMRKK